MKKDIDYIVKNGEVLIVDEFTGRIMYGRRYNNGLHQAIEAKEHVKIANESKTLATITFQNYFRTVSYTHLLNYDNEITREMAQKAKGKVIFFSSKTKLTDGYILDNDIIKVC